LYKLSDCVLTSATSIYRLSDFNDAGTTLTTTFATRTTTTTTTFIAHTTTITTHTTIITPRTTTTTTAQTIAIHPRHHQCRLAASRSKVSLLSWLSCHQIITTTFIIYHRTIEVFIHNTERLKYSIHNPFSGRSSLSKQHVSP
jgi:hypothetical protein